MVILPPALSTAMIACSEAHCTSKFTCKISDNNIFNTKIESINLGTECVQALVMCEVEPKLILLRLDKHGFGGAEGGHVDRLARVDPPQVDRQLQLTKGDWWELPCGPQSIVVASFEGGFPLNGSAPSLVA